MSESSPRTEGASPASRQRARTRGRALHALLVLAGLLVVAAPRAATAKSLYVIANVRDIEGGNPIHAYDIGPEGKLTFQAEYTVPYQGWGAVGLAFDAQSGRLFVTYEMSDRIALLNPVTMETLDPVTAPGATNLAGIVYDHSKERLYCMERNSPTLYVYRWDPAAQGLTPVTGSPFQLAGAVAFGIALDETRGQLYVGGPAPAVRVFDTSDWRLLRTIPVSRVAISVAVDPLRRYLYFGGSYPLTDNPFLTQYDLITREERHVQVDPQATVMGLGVDLETGFIYLATGVNNRDGGDDLLVFDPSLNLIEAVEDIGNPTGLVVPNGPMSYNPLRLTKTIKTASGEPRDDKDLPQVTIGAEFTYAICFDHNDLLLTDVSLVDTLPAEAAFVRATGDGVYGRYERGTHTYTWWNPPRSASPQMCLELVCRLEPNTPAGRVITNSVTLETRQTPPSTTQVQAVTAKAFQPLGVAKAVILGAAGGDATTPAFVKTGDEVTYRITFDNRNNDAPVRNVRLTDDLPRQMSFVRASDDGLFGQYDPVLHTYTWSYPHLEAGARSAVDLVVRLGPDVAGGATITNTVTAESDQTPAARATVDLKVANYAPLSLHKTLVSGALPPPDQTGRTYVEAGGIIMYALSFGNPSTNGTVTQVSLTDMLPREVSFLDADGDRHFGFYDPNTHTYTWRYPSLEPGREASVNLVVRVKEGVPPDTTIGNEAVLTATQTPPTTAQVQVVTVAKPSDAPLSLHKTLVSGAVGTTDERGRPYVDAGATITYALSCGNPATNRMVSWISVLDILPREVSFVRAEGDGDSGSYDPVEHTYTRRCASLAPGAELRVLLVVRVHETVAPNTVIGNAAAVTTRETPPTRAGAEVVVRSDPEPRAPSTPAVKGSMYIKPDHLFRNASPAKADLMVVVHLPEGLGKDAIRNVPLRLTPGNAPATGQQIFGTSTQGKVLAFFDVDPLLAATQGYGPFPLQVVGALNNGRSFLAETTIWILKFGGP